MNSMSTNLYEVNTAYQSALDKAYQEASENEGVLSDSTAQELDILSTAKDVCAEEQVKWYKNELAIAEMIGSEIVALSDRMGKHESRARWIKERLPLIVSVGRKLEFACGKISWRTSKRVDIIDALKLPVDMWRVIPERQEPDKVAIGDKLKKGELVDGAELIEINNIQIK